LRPVGEHCEGRVVAHRSDRLGAVGRHRRQDDLQVFEREAEGPLQFEEARRLAGHAGGPPGIGGVRMGVGPAVAQRLGRLDGPVLRHVGGGRRLGECVETDLVLRHPLPPRPRGGEPALDFLVLDDPAFLRVDEEHPSRPEPALANHLAGGQVEHARLARHDDETVPHLPPAAGPQAVAVERGADPHAVGEGQRRRAVPRLHQAGLILVIRLEVVGHALMAAPRLRDEHAHRLLQRPAGEDEQFEDVVERGRVASPIADHRLDLLQVGAEDRMGEHALAGPHPVDVAADGVDLAVVGQVAERVGEVPGGEGVGAVPLVDEGQRRGDRGIGQVGVVLAHLVGEQQALVDERLRGERADVAEGLLGEAEPADLDAEPLPGHEQFPFEMVAGHVRPATDERLADDRFDLAGGAADRAVVGGHVPPAEELESLRADHLLEELLRGLALPFRRRQEKVANRPVPRRRQADAGPRRRRGEKFVRHLQEDAGAVAGERIAAAGAAVGEVFQDLESLTDD